MTTHEFETSSDTSYYNYKHANKFIKQIAWDSFDILITFKFFCAWQNITSEDV